LVGASTANAYRVTVTASTTALAVGEQVTFTAKLTTDGSTPISGKSVEIYDKSPGGVKYTDSTATIEDSKITFTMSWGFITRPQTPSIRFHQHMP
jgi:uncharacterized repeat protein (TIGR01451 family)